MSTGARAPAPFPFSPALSPATKPPAPTIPNRHSPTAKPMLERLNNAGIPRRSPVFDPALFFQSKLNYDAAGLFPLFRHRRKYLLRSSPVNQKPGTSAGLGFFEREETYAASSSTTTSSSSPSPSPSVGLGPRRGPFASAASISLIASVSVMRWTAEISRARRSSAAS